MELVPLFMDGLVLIFLGITVFFAAKLSLQLKAFRESRDGLKSLIADLSGQINQAEMAITGLRESARESGRDLQELISEASALKDEMELIYDSSNRLAERLENIPARREAVRQRPPYDIPDMDEEDDEIGFDPRPQRTPSPKERPAEQKPEARSPLSPFSIRDPEFDRDDAEGADAMPEDDELDQFQSRAERELFEALQGKKKVESAGEV